MALESILSAALVYLSRQEDGVSSRLRQARRTLDGTIDALASFAGRGELVRLRAALVQDFLIGILAARNPRPNGVLPSQMAGRLELSPEEPQHWPPTEGQYDANGLSSRLGEMALLGLAITYEETRTFLVGLTQASAPTPSGRIQIGRASRSLISVVASLGLDLSGYEKAWRQMFTADSASGATATPLSATAPPNVAGTSSTGTATSAAHGDHTHGHGDQAGGTLHATATTTTPGFLSDVDKSKLDGIAPGATATPLSSTLPLNIATASSTGTAASAAHGDHTHGHGDQAGGTLHATATTTAPGFLSDADKSKLDGIAPGATATPLSSTLPLNIATASSTGTAASAAHGDHTHGHGDQAGGTLHATATTTAPGFLSDADKSKLDGIAPGATATPLSSALPLSIATASSTGTAANAAHGDHTHGHGNQPGGTLHATATTTTPGFLSDVDKSKLDGIAPGATATPLSSTLPLNIATASSTGTAANAAHGDHTHGHGNQPGGTLHATATTTAPGFLSDVDKSKLDGIAPGATKGAQGLLLYLNRFQSLVTSSVFGIDGAAVLFTADLTPEVCATAGTCQDWRMEANSVTPTALTVSIFRAPSGSVTYLLTPSVFSLGAGTRAASTAATFTVSPGDRLCALCNQPWSPGGLTIRGRLLP